MQINNVYCTKWKKVFHIMAKSVAMETKQSMATIVTAIILIKLIQYSVRHKHGDRSKIEEKNMQSNNTHIHLLTFILS